MMKVGEIVLTEKQKEYIRAKICFDRVFLQYRKLLGECGAAWRSDPQEFMILVHEIREVTGLEQAREKLERSERALTEADNIDLLKELSCNN